MPITSPVMIRRAIHRLQQTNCATFPQRSAELSSTAGLPCYDSNCVCVWPLAALLSMWTVAWFARRLTITSCHRPRLYTTPSSLVVVTDLTHPTTHTHTYIRFNLPSQVTLQIQYIQLRINCDSSLTIRAMLSQVSLRFYLKNLTSNDMEHYFLRNKTYIYPGLWSRSRTSRSRDGLEAFFERLDIVSVAASYV